MPALIMRLVAVTMVGAAEVGNGKSINPSVALTFDVVANYDCQCRASGSSEPGSLPAPQGETITLTVIEVLQEHFNHDERFTWVSPWPGYLTYLLC